MTKTLFAAAAVLAVAAVPALAQDSAGGITRAPMLTTGEQVYATVCQACHMADAKGATGAATIPALAANPRLAGAAYPITVVAGGKGAMPGFSGTLSNAQMAGVITYVRTHFGNSYAKPVTEAEVAKIAKPPPPASH